MAPAEQLVNDSPEILPYATGCVALILFA